MTDGARSKPEGPCRPSAHGLLVFLLFTVVVACWLDRPPPAQPASAPAGRFSAERAAAHLREIVAEPHPIGSAAHERVRDYLLAALARMGLRAEVQRAVAVSARYGVAGSVQNVLARIPGTEPGPAVLLAAHYDSVPAGPGAADDGAGVATLLETARALRACPPLRRDVILLFTDGEEAGLLGAEAFVRGHPWRKDVGIVCNFEARGTAGPAMLFETSPGNEGLVREFAGSASHPAGSSLAVSIYRALPNDTDLTVFLHSKMAGLNFAFVEGWSGYHTPQDRLASLDLRSLQQEGDAALALARRLSQAPLKAEKQDAVFFSIGPWLVHYPTSSALPLALVPPVFLAFAVVVGLRRRDFAPAELLLGALLFLLPLLLTAGLGAQAPRCLSTLHGQWLPRGDWARSPWYAAAIGCVGPAVLLPFFARVRRVRPQQGVVAGALLPWTLMSLLAARYLPGGSYLITWPLLFASLALFPGERERGYATFLRLAPTAVPALLLLSPVIRGLFVAMGLDGPGCAGIGLLVSLLVLLLLPQLDQLREAGLPIVWLPAGLLVVFVGLGAATTRWDVAHPRPVNLLYALDADTRTAFLAGTGGGAETWSAQALGPAAHGGALPQFDLANPRQRIRVAPSRPFPLPAPQVRVISDDHSGTSRALHLHVAAPPGARSVELASDDVTGAVLRGVPLPRNAPRWSLTYQAPPPNGFDLVVNANPGRTVTLRVVSVASGLPTALGVPPRPPAVTSIQEGDRTMVGCTFRFVWRDSALAANSVGGSRPPE